ncbi:Serine/threonine protein kinase [Planctomycetales bacterium 10988]|nr:Serine/threonine protein kinase [Planctomycetales bacterium 10988]
MTMDRSPSDSSEFDSQKTNPSPGSPQEELGKTRLSPESSETSFPEEPGEEKADFSAQQTQYSPAQSYSEDTISPEEEVDPDATLDEDDPALKEFASQQTIPPTSQKPPINPFEATVVGQASASENFSDTTIPPSDGEMAEPPSDSGDPFAGLADDLQESISSTWGSVAAGRKNVNQTLKPFGTKPSELWKSGQTSLSVRQRSVTLRDPAQAKGLDSSAEFELLDRLGQGGMGVVYLARQTSIDREIALKMLKPEMANNPVQRNQFLAEAAVTGALDHPNIVPVHDLGANDAGTLFYAMKRVNGTPWSETINHMSLDENLDALLRVCDAMAFAHSRNFIHRDLKPENVMMGNFGEVLLMDWGLALDVSEESRATWKDQRVMLCGSPAYMAPEMATGPLSKIGIASDIYLLGAILFEIVTGYPPHNGKDAMSCLFNVGMNRIEPTTKSGELLDIAMHAMATMPKHRYASVKDFQQAIRDYRSHSESILLSSKASQDLLRAENTKDYDDFAKALFGYREAYELWPENPQAQAGIYEAQKRYAATAFAKGDLDLADSLLDKHLAEHQSLHQEISAAQAERKARKRRLAAALKTVQALVISVLIILAVAALWIHSERNAALEAANLERIERERAEKAEDLAKQNEAKAIDQQKIAESQKALAEKNLAEAERQEALAIAAAKEEKKARIAALAAEELARQQKERAEQSALSEAQAKEEANYRAYVATIGLASANIAGNSFGQARQQLAGSSPPYRHWEWGRLEHLTELAFSTLGTPGDEPLQAASLSPNGEYFATSNRLGMLTIWNLKTQEQVRQWQAHEGNVRAVAYSPDGKHLATGGDDSNIFLWDLSQKTNSPVQTLDNHAGPILCLEYSQDGKQLLSGSADYTARLWNIESGEEEVFFADHIDWVWDVDFSPDGKDVLTASQDGKVIISSINRTKSSPLPSNPSGEAVSIGEGLVFYDHHTGPVYSAVYTQDGEQVLSGSYDKTVRLWNTADCVENWINSGHQGRVYSVAFSPSGKWLVSGSADNTARVWDRETGKEVRRFRGHGGSVIAAYFLPDESGIVTASADGTVRLWKMDSPGETIDLKGHKDEILAVTTSPDGKRIATGSLDRSVRIWDSATGEELLTLQQGHGDKVVGVAVSPDGKWGVTTSLDRTLRVWDLTDGVEERVLEGHRDVVRACAYSSDGKWIVSGGDDTTAIVWDAETGEIAQRFEEHRSPIRCIAISPDSTLAITCDENARARVWNIQSGERVQLFEAHSVAINAVSFLPSGRFALTASEDRVASLWNIESGEEYRTMRHPVGVSAVNVSPTDGQLAATGANDGILRFWNLQDGEQSEEIQAHKEPITSVQFSADGKSLVSTSLDGTVALWEVASGRKKLEIPAHQGFCFGAAFVPGTPFLLTAGDFEAKLWDLNTGTQALMLAQMGAVSGVSYAPNGSQLLTSSWDGFIHRWNAETGRSEGMLPPGHRGYINSVEHSPDGRLVVSAGDDGQAILWETESGNILQRWLHSADDGTFYRVFQARFSPDGKFVVTAAADGFSTIWAIDQEKPLKKLGLAGTMQGWTLDAAFSPDGKYVLSGCQDATARLWEVESGDLIRIFEGHAEAIRAVQFFPYPPSTHPDQEAPQRIVTASDDLTAKVWDLRTGDEILTLKGHLRELTDLALSPDRLSLITTSRDASAKIWQANDWHNQPEAKEKVVLKE